MSRNVSLLILFGTFIAIGVLFFQVISPFVFPLFFAGVLAVLFRPLFVWVRRRCFGRSRLAGALVTVAVIAIVVVPLGGMLTLAGTQPALSTRATGHLMTNAFRTSKCRDLRHNVVPPDM